MPNVKYVGSTVNSAANELTTVAGRFQPVSSSVQTKTGVMIGCKGFNTIAQATSSSYSSNIDLCEKQVAGIVGDGTVFICSQTISDTIVRVCITLTAAIGSSYLTFIIIGKVPQTGIGIGCRCSLIFGIESIGYFIDIIQLDAGQTVVLVIFITLVAHCGILTICPAGKAQLSSRTIGVGQGIGSIGNRSYSAEGIVTASGRCNGGIIQLQCS